MKTANEHVKAANQLLRLSEEQKQNPMVIFDDFFTTYHLKDARELFKDWLQAGLTHANGLFEEPMEWHNLIFFHEKLEELVEACYLLKEEFETKKNLQAQR